MKVVTIFGKVGGMSDVGKFVTAHALSRPQIEVKAIMMADEKMEGNDYGIEVDVKDEEGQRTIKEALQAANYSKCDVNDEDACRQVLDDALIGADVVVACLGNRQPSKSRWLGKGTQYIAGSMKRKQVPRIVELSSMGIGGDNHIRTNAISWLWWAMLHTILASGLRDLLQMEQTVKNNCSDYLLVRAMGLTPEVLPTGAWSVISDKTQAQYIGSTSKSDVALFMLEEALNPTLRSCTVTLGPPLPKANK